MLRELDDELIFALAQILWCESITGLAIVKEDGTFWKANPAFCRITEYAEYELRKLRFQDITMPKDVGVDSEMAKLVASGDYENYDLYKSYVTKTGKIQPVFLRVTGLHIEGKFMYFIGEIAPLDRHNEEPRPDSGIHAASVRAAFFKRVRENMPIILFTLGGLGILLGYATGILKLKGG